MTIRKIYRTIKGRILPFILYKGILRLIKKIEYIPSIMKNHNNILYITMSLPSYKTTNTNWGDDINIFLCEILSGKKVIPYKHALFRTQNYLVIGSIINWFSNSKSIIWGSGVLSSQYKLKHKPSKVLAVRGPLTREYLIQKGVECPPVFGDPALLIPLFYNPQEVPKKYLYGLILHHRDKKNPAITELIRNHKKDLLIIDIVNYGTWSSFIDKILSCQYILSTSLHGIIISDAYNIPNLWCKIYFSCEDNGFKFRDYYLSVKKDITSPYIIKDTSTEKEILQELKKWTPIQINIKPLINSCPFINPTIQQKLNDIINNENSIFLKK